jgi:hypothetical protein
VLRERYNTLHYSHTRSGGEHMHLHGAASIEGEAVSAVENLSAKVMALSHVQADSS